MSTNQIRIIWTVALYLLIFAFGFWLTRAGKPYNAIVLTIHKLISVAAVVFLVVTMVQINKAARLNAGELAAAVVTGLLFIGTFATGALLTAEKPMPAVVLWLHRITPFLTVLSSAATLYLSLSRR